MAEEAQQDRSLDDLIGRSGDSTLRQYHFKNGVVEIELDLWEADCMVRLVVPTDTVFAENLKKESEALLTCRIEVLKLTEHLRTQHGYYVPPGDFAGVMKDQRAGLTLAYGRREDEVQWLFTLTGYSRLFSCLISHKDSIRWYECE